MANTLNIEFYVPARRIFISKTTDGVSEDVRDITVPDTNNVVDEVNVLFQLFSEDEEYDTYDIEVYELEDIEEEIKD